jgi:hypothetical protein
MKTPVKTHTGKTTCFRPVGSISDQFPTRWIPDDKSPPRATSLCLARQVSASRNKSLPRTTSLRLARQVSASHELPPTLTGVWAVTRGTSLRHEHLHHNAWGNDSPRHANAPAGGHASSWPRQEP